MRLKNILAEDGQVIGTWNLINDPGAVELMCKAGFDFVIHDMEHGTHSLDNTQNMVRAAERAGKNLLLRPPGIDTGLIQRVMDAGCHGLMVPNVRSVADVGKIVESALYPPSGNRGLSPFTRAMGYDGSDVPARMAAANSNCFLGILIEDQDGISALPEIVATYGEHLSVVYVGLYDLAKTIGSTGDLMSDKMRHHIRQIVDICKRGDASVGMLVNSAEMVTFAQDLGVRFLAYLNDTAILYRSTENLCSASRLATKKRG
ncbi:HpcH/HpaI aldolase family protein [Kordiimonas sp.]|uniref:HpcH/HpaI aldolase family protein n=1 Tax=Kordiimonas sp. TaxID=1970157 RepID=UPI003A8D0707